MEDRTKIKTLKAISVVAALVGVVAALAGCALFSARRDAEAEREVAEVSRVVDRNQRVLDRALANLKSANETMRAITDYTITERDYGDVLPAEVNTPEDVAAVQSAIGSMDIGDSTGLMIDLVDIVSLRPTKLLFSFDGFNGGGDCLEIRDDGWAWLKDGKVIYAGKGPRAPAIFVRAEGGTRWGNTFEVEMPTEQEMWAWMEASK